MVSRMTAARSGRGRFAAATVLLAFALAVSAALGIGAPGQAYAASDLGLRAGIGAGEATELSTNASTAVKVVAKHAMSCAVSLKEKETYKLALSATKGAKVTCTSSQPKVATVTSKGVVKALKAGKTTITIKAKKGKKTATLKVKITVLKSSKYKAVKKVAGTVNWDVLAPGGTAKMTAAVSPAKASNKNVTFKSSNTAVIDVAPDGKITAKKAGTAKVTVTSCANAKKKAVKTIRVVPSAGGVKPGNLGGYAWADLKKIADAIAAAPSDAEGLAIAEAYHLVDNKGKLPTGVWSESLTFASADKSIYGGVRIIGFRHDLKTGGGKAGITFQVMGATPIQHLINPLTPSEYGDDFEVLATGSWSASEMRSWLNGELYAKLPADLTKNIVAVDKKTNSENRYSGADTTTTSDKLWLLSPAEIYGTVPGLTGGQKFSDKEIATYTAEGTQYKLFKDNGITTSADGYGEEPLGYWDITLRSPYSSNQWLEICNISGKGLSLDRTPTSYSGSGDEMFHLAPCFCF